MRGLATKNPSVLHYTARIIVRVEEGSRPPTRDEVVTALVREYLQPLAELNGPSLSTKSWEIVDCVAVLHPRKSLPDTGPRSRSNKLSRRLSSSQLILDI